MDNFTPEQIEQFLEEFFDVVGRRQYVGARYVPIFGRKDEASIEWDNTAPYEPLTIVLYQGNSFTSRTYVPAGVAITNTSYWANTGNYNAQVEAYRQEVLRFKGEFNEDILAIEQSISVLRGDVNADLQLMHQNIEGDIRVVQNNVDDLREDVADDYVPFPNTALYPKYGTSGQVLTTLADGTTKWENPVVPSYAEAEQIINAWLNAHPEATTTVQNNSITDAKLVQSGGVLSKVNSLTDVGNALREYNDNAAEFIDENDSDWQNGSVLTDETLTTTRRLMPVSPTLLKNGDWLIAYTDKNVAFVTYDMNYNKVSQTEWLANNAYVHATSDCYVRVVVKKFNGDVIAANERNTRLLHIVHDVETTLDNYSLGSDFWEQGTCAANFSNVSNAARLRTKNYSFVKKGSQVILESLPSQSSAKQCWFSMQMLNIDTGAYTYTDFAYGKRVYNITSDCYVRFVQRFNDSTNITPSQSNVSIEVVHNQVTEHMQSLNVLGLGDSICYGARNNGNGFLGETGVNWTNGSVTGATIAQIKSNNVYAQLNAALPTTSYDAVIVNGGTNDYGENAVMGAVPTRPIDPNNDSPETMDKTTVMGGLNYLFYKMMEKYPNAQRIFVMPNKQWDHDVIQNTAGWNFDEFHENVLKVCALYGVIVVDVYTESPINTRFAQYRSTENYSATPFDGTKDWVNSDGIHPLPYGYTNGLVPYVKQALMLVTKKA